MGFNSRLNVIVCTQKAKRGLDMKILIAEDDPVSRRLLQATLVKWSYDVVVAHDGVETWEALQDKDAPKLAILDWMMPGMDGVEICRKIRQRKETPYTYIILLTTKSEKEDIIKGMNAGADDYITKPFVPQELKVRLRAGRRIIELQTALLETQEALRIQATHDSLTGLWNRAMTLNALYRELSRAEREKISVSVIMADIDYFKQINDTYGHMAGDAVLREVAQRIRSSERPYDVVGRYGGEEFLTVLSRCDEQSALKVAERIRRKISEKPIDISEGMIPVTISLGVATRGEGQRIDADTLVQVADDALYRAKENGRNRVKVGGKD